MTLTELRYIVAVAREKHFGKAAAMCFVSQPTLSVAVRKIEEELGTVIFERSKNDVRVTAVGKVIVEQAQHVLDEAGRIKHLAIGGEQLTGPLKLGIIVTVGPYLLPRLIPQLQRFAPNMPLLIREGNSSLLREKLITGAIDAIIVSLPFRESGIEYEPLFDEALVVLLPAKHPLAQHELIKAEQLARQQQLLLAEGLREQVLSVCPQSELESGNDGDINWQLGEGSLETVRHMVASGAGIAVMPTIAVSSEFMSNNDLVAVRRFWPPAPQRNVVLAWRKGFPRTEAIDCLQKSFKACDLTTNYC